jgi:hypothetical protein
MNDYAAKAHSIWATAAIPDAKSLDDSEAGNLGRKLRWAADWYRAACAPSRLEKERLKKIERAAKKLDRLLAESPETREKLDGFWLGGGSSGEDLRRATVGVSLIRRAARLAQKRKRTDTFLRSKFTSPQGFFIRRVATAYEAAAGREARRSCSPKGGPFYGPFVRFLQATAREFGVPCPSDDTIKVVLAERKP